LLIKYVKIVLWRVAKRLSYIEDARCLKVKDVNDSLCRSVTHNNASLSRRLRNRFFSAGEIIQHCKKREFSQKGCLPSVGENVLPKTTVNYSFFIFYFFIFLFKDENFSCYVRCRCYFTTSNLAHLLYVSPDNPATKLEQSTKLSTCIKPHVFGSFIAMA